MINIGTPNLKYIYLHLFQSYGRDLKMLKVGPWSVDLDHAPFGDNLSIICWIVLA